jgi:acyl-CoA synthetase (NDP forming)
MYIDIINAVSKTGSFTLDEIFHPRSVAIVGASPDNFMTFAAWAVSSLKAAGFPAIYPVNPRHNEAFGLACYPTVSAIPGPVDHVIVCIPAGKSMDVLDDCAQKGVMSVHFFTAGFSESGERSRVELERDMLQKARAGGFRIIGPNCTGLFVPEARLTTSDRMPMEPGDIAFMSQSGGHSQDMPMHGGPRGLRFSKVISYGNALDIGECELLEYFTNDTATNIIAIYIEGVRDGKRFRSALERACARKPVVVYKGGTTEAGLRTAMSHTASMTSSVKAFQAMCRQANAIQVGDIQELIDVLVALSFARPYPSGKGIAVVGVGGGPSVEAGDRMEAVGLELSALSPEVKAQLKNLLPNDGAIFTNPLDTTNLIYPDVIYNTLKVIGGSPGIDMIMYHMGFHPVTRWGGGIFSSEFFLKPATEALHKSHREINKPVLMALGQASDMAGMEEVLKVQAAFVNAGLPVFRSIEKAGLAMERVAAWRGRFGAG